MQTLMRAALLAMIGAVGGCSQDIAMRDPLTERTDICRNPGRGLNPWSQTLSCVGDREAEGWIRVQQD